MRAMPQLTDEQLKNFKVRQLQKQAQGGQQVKVTFSPCVALSQVGTSVAVRQLAVHIQLAL